MADFVWNSSQAVALAAAVLEGDVAGLGKALFLLKALVLVWFCFLVEFCINQIKINGFTKNEIYS